MGRFAKKLPRYCNKENYCLTGLTHNIGVISRGGIKHRFIVFSIVQ